MIDGFDTTRPQAPANAADIRALTQLLQQERVVSWFTTPTDLEARVSAAVTMAGLTRQLDLQPTTALDACVGIAGDSSAHGGISEAIVAAGDHQRALKIDLRDTWWSTRLYLVAALADRLTQARRILVVLRPLAVAGAAALPPAGVPAPSAMPPGEERFVGQISTGAILSIIGPKLAALGAFAQWLHARPVGYNEVHAEIRALLDGWRNAFGDAPGTHINEATAKVDLTPELLHRWFGDAMLQQPMHIADLQRASIVDLLRLLDYRNDYVPVLTRDAPEAEGKPASERVDVWIRERSMRGSRGATSWSCWIARIA